MMVEAWAPWRDYSLNLRNRLLASERFQRWAAAFPLTRPIARYRARKLFDLCAGFVYSQILYACVRLRLIELLTQKPLTAAEVAASVQLPRSSVERLLRAACALDLLETRRGGRYGPGKLGAVLLGNRGIAAMVEHHAMLYTDLADPIELLKRAGGGTALAAHWAYAEGDDPAKLSSEKVDAYTDLMAASQPFVANEILEAYPFAKHGHRCLLDVAGGNGTFLSEVAARVPEMRLQLFDLPAVAARAHERFQQQGLDDRASAHGGDIFKDPLPSGADIVSLVRVIHDHNDDEARQILCAVRKALPADGKLLLAEPMSDTRGAEPIGDAYFGIYLLAMGSGRPRSPDELRDLLHAAGFDRIRLLRTRMPLLTRVMLASPAAG